MSVPSQINDGNWDLLLPYDGSYAFPFSDKGDHTTFEARLRYKQDQFAYRPRAPMTRVEFTLGSGYLVALGNPRDCGNGLFEWEDMFSSIPIKRVEYASIPYTQQWWQAATDVDPNKYFYDVNFDIEEQTFTVSGEVEYEYFRDTAPAPLIKPRVFLLFGFLQSIGGTPIIGNRLVAEDSEVSIYMGKIFQRRTVYVKIQPPTAVPP